MTRTSLGSRDIVDFTLDTYEGWHPVTLIGEPGAETWAADLVAGFQVPEALASSLLEQLGTVQKVLHEDDPTGATRARVFLPYPEAGVVNAILTYQLIWLETDDSPESFQADVDAHANDRAPGYEIRGFESWRAPHHEGELVGFTHLTATSTPEETEALLEQRVVFAIFPVGAAQMFQLVFRSVFLGGFGDMVTETQAIADSLRVTLGVAA